MAPPHKGKSIARGAGPCPAKEVFSIPLDSRLPIDAFAGSGGRTGLAPGQLRFRKLDGLRSARLLWPAARRARPSRVGIRLAFGRWSRLAWPPESRLPGLD